jgi:N-acetylglucosaminyl-diphospho-decaprenol L-rhamnosyltransferase
LISPEGAVAELITFTEQVGAAVRPTLSVIIPTWNTRDLLAACLTSIARQTAGRGVETIVVDNGSIDGTAELLRTQFPSVHVVTNATNLGFACAANQGAAASANPYLLFLNTDAELMSGALDTLLRVIEEQPRAGIVGAQLRNADGTFQGSHAPFPSLVGEFLVLSGLGRLSCGAPYPSRGPDDEKGPQVVDWVGGACLLARKIAFEAVGGFDESFFLYGEEVDLCYRMRSAGWEVWYQPGARVMHLGGSSSTGQPTEREAQLYRGRVHYFRTHYGRGAAALLAFMIIASTAIKRLVHGALRAGSGGRYGRPVVSVARVLSVLRRA